MLNMLISLLNGLLEQILGFFGYEPFFEVEPTFLKMLFEALKTMIMG